VTNQVIRASQSCQTKFSAASKYAMSITGKFVALKHSLSFNGAQVIRAYSSRDNIKQIDKSVFISQSTDIFTNLALEHWFYRNYDFSKHHVLLLWRNDPCLVFGRHQNPWLECNVPVAKKWGITLARRNSGGGTVYHDNGNLNLTFFTPHERYNRRYNLSIIVNALFRQWGLKSVINERDDILVNGESKVSFFCTFVQNDFILDIIDVRKEIFIILYYFILFYYFLSLV